MRHRPKPCDPRAMNAIELPWETWRAIIAVLREKGLPDMLEHADRIEQQLDQHPPDQPTVRLSLTDDLCLRSYNRTRWQLGCLARRAHRRGPAAASEAMRRWHPLRQLAGCTSRPDVIAPDAHCVAGAMP
jgi:hypothetical protein